MRTEKGHNLSLTLPGPVRRIGFSVSKPRRCLIVSNPVNSYHQFISLKKNKKLIQVIILYKNRLPVTGAQERIKTADPIPSLSATTLSMVCRP